MSSRVEHFLAGFAHPPTAPTFDFGESAAKDSRRLYDEQPALFPVRRVRQPGEDPVNNGFVGGDDFAGDVPPVSQEHHRLYNLEYRAPAHVSETKSASGENLMMATWPHAGVSVSYGDHDEPVAYVTTHAGGAGGAEVAGMGTEESRRGGGVMSSLLRHAADAYARHGVQLQGSAALTASGRGTSTALAQGHTRHATVPAMDWGDNIRNVPLHRALGIPYTNRSPFQWQPSLSPEPAGNGAVVHRKAFHDPDMEGFHLSAGRPAHLSLPEEPPVPYEGEDVYEMPNGDASATLRASPGWSSDVHRTFHAESGTTAELSPHPLAEGIDSETLHHPDGSVTFGTFQNTVHRSADGTVTPLSAMTPEFRQRHRTLMGLHLRIKEAQEAAVL